MIDYFFSNNFILKDDLFIFNNFILKDLSTESGSSYNNFTWSVNIRCCAF